MLKIDRFATSGGEKCRKVAKIDVKSASSGVQSWLSGRLGLNRMMGSGQMCTDVYTGNTAKLANLDRHCDPIPPEMSRIDTSRHLRSLNAAEMDTFRHFLH